MIIKEKTNQFINGERMYRVTAAEDISLSGLPASNRAERNNRWLDW